MTLFDKLQAILQYSGPMLQEHRTEANRLLKKRSLDLIDELSIDSIFFIYKPPIKQVTLTAELTFEEKLNAIVNFTGTISLNHQLEAMRLLNKLKTSRLSSIDELSINGIVEMWDVFKAPSP